MTPHFVRSNSRITLAAVVASLLAGLVILNHSFEPARASTSSQAPGNLKDAKTIEEGAKLFGPACSAGYCHGNGGVGGSAPRLRGEGLEPSYLFDIISNGIPGSSMPAFRSVFDEQQIWKMVAFIMSPVKPDETSNAAGKAPSTTSTGTTTADSHRLTLVGDIRAGKALFFDSTQPRSCHTCHTIAGARTSIGPDLSKAATRSPKELFLLIVLPHNAVDPRFALTRLTLKDGEKLEGLKMEEDQHSLRLYDLSVLPGVKRTVRKGDIATIQTTDQSPMPNDYANLYTMKQLLNLISFLKSADGEKPTITLRDLF